MKSNREIYDAKSIKTETFHRDGFDYTEIQELMAEAQREALEAYQMELSKRFAAYVWMIIRNIDLNDFINGGKK